MEMFTVMKKEAVLSLLEDEFGHVNLETEVVSINDSLGRILAEPVVARENIPDFVRSTVDGYAVKSKNTVGASEALPAFLDFIGSVEMGQETRLTVGENQTVYVPTGGMVPEGADAMVMIEYTDSFGDEIAVNKPCAVLENIIGIGDDVKVGEVVLEAGTYLSTQHIGALASLGYANVHVKRRPRVSIISTGDELVSVASVPKIGQIRDVNTYSLLAMVDDLGCEIVTNQHLKDDFESLKKALLEAEESSDIVFLSGGSSVGNHDMTSDIINATGEPGVLVHGVAIKPGKPTIVARVGNTAVFGLPGHPASCIIAFKAIVEPFIQNQLMKNKQVQNRVEAVSAFQMHVSSGRDVFFMVKVENKNGVQSVYPVNGKSGMVSMFAKADGYIEIPMEKEGLEIGEKVMVTLFR